MPKQYLMVRRFTVAAVSLITFLSFKSVDIKLPIMTKPKQEQANLIDNSKKSILARGCDPTMSLEASKAIPPLIGNPEYVPTTNDSDFIAKLESRQWSVIFFAPGACRFSAAKRPIPGGNYQTEGWTLEQYRNLILKLQGNEVKIIETQDERETVGLLKNVLAEARVIE